MTRKLTTATAALVALVATLTACSSTGETATAPPTTTPTAAATTAPAAPATPEPCVPAAVGETVATMAEIACAEEAGLVAYRLDAGAVIVDPASAELPQAAVDAIVAPVRAKVEETGAEMQAVHVAAQATAQYASSQTGRNVVLVVPLATSTGTMYGAMSADGSTELGRASFASTARASQAATQAWIAGQPDAERFVVLVAE